MDTLDITQNCPICLEEMSDINVTVTSCNHKFHSSCLMGYVYRNPNGRYCPCCRKDIVAGMFCYNKTPTISTPTPSTLSPSTPTLSTPHSSPASIPTSVSSSSSTLLEVKDLLPPGRYTTKEILEIFREKNIDISCFSTNAQNLILNAQRDEQWQNEVLAQAAKWKRGNPDSKKL
jgi:hypothetical protein